MTSRPSVSNPADTAANRETVRAILDAEITAAYARKGSLETRAGALVAGAVGLVTVFLALRQQLDIADELAMEPFSQRVVAGLVVIGVSLVAALVTAVPLSYPIVSGDLLRVAFEEVEEGLEIRSDLLDLRASTLTTMTRSNQAKAWSLFVGVVALLLAVSLFAWTILDVSVL